MISNPPQNAVITDDVVTADTFVVLLWVFGCKKKKHRPIVSSTCNNNAQHSFKKRSGSTALLPHNSNRQFCLIPNY